METLRGRIERRRRFRGGEGGGGQERDKKTILKKPFAHAGPAGHDLHPPGLERSLDQVDLLLGEQDGEAPTLLLQSGEPVCLFWFWFLVLVLLVWEFFDVRLRRSKRSLKREALKKKNRFFFYCLQRRKAHLARARAGPCRSETRGTS